MLFGARNAGMAESGIAHDWNEPFFFRIGASRQNPTAKLSVERKSASPKKKGD